MAVQHPEMTAGRSSGSPLFGWTRVSAEQLFVLQAVSDGRVRRSLLYGQLEPHLLDGRDVIWVLRALVLRGLVRLQPIGHPLVTRRGRALLDGPD